MADYNLNVLFVPFNAAQRQYERNDDTQDTKTKEEAILARSVSKLSVGNESSEEESSLDKTTIMPRKKFGEIIKESIPFDQMQSTQPVPDVVFVSQEPKELKFPTKFTIRTKAKRKTKAYKYRILVNSSTDTKGHIRVYIREQLYTEKWLAEAKPLTWPSTFHQNVLMVEIRPPNNEKSYRVAGVHLISTRKDSGKDGAFEELVTQCKEDEIDAVLGDFNMSTSLHNQSGRRVGGDGTMDGDEITLTSKDGLVATKEDSVSIKGLEDAVKEEVVDVLEDVIDIIKGSDKAKEMRHYMGWILFKPMIMNDRVVGNHTSLSTHYMLDQGQDIKPSYFSYQPPVFISIFRGTD